jgi:hypothetical protein
MKKRKRKGFFAFFYKESHDIQSLFLTGTDWLCYPLIGHAPKRMPPAPFLICFAQNLHNVQVYFRPFLFEVCSKIEATEQALGQNGENYAGRKNEKKKK